MAKKKNRMDIDVCVDVEGMDKLEDVAECIEQAFPNISFRNKVNNVYINYTVNNFGKTE